MGRAPCCEKMGLKKGPWTPEEDQTLVTYIQHYGHGNWRALPKLAGLLRCGKSCRLRWTNYLRPDIKRGNFTKEEEDTIIKLHEMLGNRWSTIAAKLPGRTDNEIKNVWHTHLKKRLKHNQTSKEGKRKVVKPSKPTSETDKAMEMDVKNVTKTREYENDSVNHPVSPPQPSSSEFSSGADSSIVTGENHQDMGNVKDESMESSSGTFPAIDESFWTQTWPTGDNLQGSSNVERKVDQFPLSSVPMTTAEDMEFWYNLFIGAGELTELPEL